MVASHIWYLVGFIILGGALCWMQIKFGPVEKELDQLKTEIEVLKSSYQRCCLSAQYNNTGSASAVYQDWNAILQAVDLAVMKSSTGNTLYRSGRSAPSSPSGRVGSSLAEELAVAFTKALDQICVSNDKLCLPGPKGESGAPGWPGQPGVKGEKGVQGTTGRQGPEGIQGSKGNKGEDGVHGERGDPGPKGEVGPMGDKGEKGRKGEEADATFALWTKAYFDGYVGVSSSSSRSISVFSFPAFLRVGDEVLLIQMQGSNSGHYEIHNVSLIDGSTVHFNQFIRHSYTSSKGAAAQLVKIEYFNNLWLIQTISSKPWDGQTGGIVALRAGALFIEQGGGIDVSKLGFRGGPKKERGHWVGVAGESWPQPGFPDYHNANPNGGGGGSGYCNCGEAAGGGSYGTVGNTPSGSSCGGGSHGQNGHMYGDAQLSKLYLGSGGGGGCRDDDGCEYSDGANGGGLIYIMASKAVIKGSLKSTGGDSPGGSSHACDDTIGGPGSGGTIYLRANELVVDNPSSTCNVDGGNRAYISQPNIYTGTGGKGRVRIDYNKLNGHTRGTSGAKNEEKRFSNVGYWGSF